MLFISDCIDSERLTIANINICYKTYALVLAQRDATQMILSWLFHTTCWFFFKSIIFSFLIA